MNNKEKIFQVSIDLFSKYGYDGVSVRQIAREVGIKEALTWTGDLTFFTGQAARHSSQSLRKRG